MSQLGEAIAMFNLATVVNDKNYCEGKKHEPAQTGPNLIDGLTGTPTPENLLENMKKHSKRNKGTPHIPTVPPKVDGSDGWNIKRCNRDRFPWQTHHIIPKKFLPTQPVCVWLTASYTKHPEYQLEKDTKYSTDHSNNGYCMPFATNTYQWQKASTPAEKEAAAFELMANTGIQLHQGNHNKKKFEEEFGEKDEVELEPYLESIEALLRRINNSARDHTNVCEECKQSGKKKVQPLDKIVAQVDLVSLITKLRIDANKVFVSERAYNYYESKKVK